MKKRTFIYFKITFLIGAFLLMLTSCEREYSDEVEFATYPDNANVFIDGFSGGLEYLPFDGSKLDAFRSTTA